MPYITLADLPAKIPQKYLIQSLDDDNDGIIDAWGDVEADAAAEVDAILSLRYLVPLKAPLPPVVRMAMIYMCAATCYTRRETAPDQNPFFADAAAFKAQLRDIAAGKMSLIANDVRPKPTEGGNVITQPSGLGHAGRLLV